MGKFDDDKNNHPNVGKQNKHKMIIIYKRIQIKVRITKLEDGENKWDFRGFWKMKWKKRRKVVEPFRKRSNSSNRKPEY